MTAEGVAQLEETVVLMCLLSVFAMCVENAAPRLVTAHESGYRLVARSDRASGYSFAIWRREPLRDADSALVTVAGAPGMTQVSAAHVSAGAIPMDDLESRWLFAELWGVTAEFRHPGNADEQESLRRLAWL